MCEVVPAVECELVFEPRSARQARRFVSDHRCPVHAHPTTDALLVVSELVTNGLRHGAPPIVLGVECRGAEGMKVTVRDGSGKPPHQENPGPMSETGRGITLVDYISQAWGVETDGGSKTVWVILDG